MINLEEQFSPRVNPGDANYPFGSIKDNTSPGANDGTPLSAVWGNDWEGFAQAAMTEAGITPSGLPDTAQDSQLLDAVKVVASGVPSVIESIRRSYAEAGYNLVAGSFEAGGTLVNANDVLLQGRTGKAFSGPAGPVTPGTNPVGDANWKPVTDELLRGDLIYGFDGLYERVSTVSEVSTGIFPIGTQLILIDRDRAIFEVVSGGVSNGVDILAAGGGNTAVLSKDQKIYAEHLGVIAGSFSSENKVAVVNAIKYSSGHRVPVHFKNARYPAWNYIIDVPGAEVVGAGIPSYKSDLSGLIDGTGTIFDGRVMFRGDEITLTGFGADAGTSSVTALVQDAIVVIGNTGSTIAASVINHKYKDLIGVVAAPDSTFHGILLQGINHLGFDNLVAVNGLFGVVIKCQNVIGGKVIGVNQGNTSCYIKGDLGAIAGNTYGVVENVSIDEIIYTGSGVNNVVAACKIHGNSAKVSNVNIGTVKSTGGGVALHVQSSTDTTQVVGVDVGSIQGRLNYQELIVDAINPDSIYGVNIGQITTYNPRRGVIVEAKTDHSFNVHVGSIVGTNTGTKDIADLDVVLKGGFDVDDISVSSSNANPTVAVTTMRRQKVTKSNIPLYYERPLTLLNGHVNFDPVNVFRLVHNGDGFGFAGRINPLAATGTVICNLPALLTIKPKMIAVPYSATDFSFKTAFVYIDGTSVSLVHPSDLATIKWVDMSSIFVNFKSYLN